MSENLNYTTEGYIPPARKKSKRGLVVLLAVLLVLLVAAGLLLYLHQNVICGFRAFRALKSYLSQDRYSASIAAEVRNDSIPTELSSVLVKTEEEGLDVFSLQFGEDLVYLSDKGIFLSDGSAYSLEQLLPQLDLELGFKEKLYLAGRVTRVSSEGDTEIYRIATEGDEALSLLRSASPDLASKIKVINEVSLAITVKEQTLSGLHLDASFLLHGETPLDVSVDLTDIPVDGSYKVPDMILNSIRNAPRGDGVKLIRDLLRFYIAWSKFETADPRAAEAVIKAKCGLLNFSTAFNWYSRIEEEGRVDYFVRSGRVIYRSTGETDESATAENQTMVIAVKLFGLAYEMCSENSGNYIERDGKYIYSTELSEEIMDLILTSVFPTSKTMKITLNSGTLELVLADDAVESVSLKIEGTVRVLVLDLPVELTANLNMIEAGDLPF